MNVGFQASDNEWKKCTWTRTIERAVSTRLIEYLYIYICCFFFLFKAGITAAQLVRFVSKLLLLTMLTFRLIHRYSAVLDVKLLMCLLIR